MRANTPSTSDLIITITNLNATDNIDITGYCLSESVSLTACMWSPTKPSNYTFSNITEGIPINKTLYVWAKDTAGNISNSLSATTTITLPDITKPVITTFTTPPISASQTIPVEISATDNSGSIASYCITETNNIESCVWDVQKPSTYSFASAGNKTLYVFAQDAAGNVSDSKSLSVAILFTLNVSIIGKGSVHSSPMGDIACISGSNLACSGLFENAAEVILTASPEITTSIFTGWDAPGCTTSTCRVIMSDNINVTAVFALAPKNKLTLEANTGYNELTDAYKNATSTIYSMSTELTESWSLNDKKDIVLTGGYLADYKTRLGFTTLNGKLTIINGSLRVVGVKIK